MSLLLQKVKVKLARLLNMKFGSTPTDQGTLQHDGEEITVGTDVFIEDDEGNLIPAPDGRYHNPSDNYTYVVEGGIVTETIQGEGGTQEDMDAEDVKKEVDNIPEQSGEVPPEAFNELVGVVKDLTTEIHDVEGQMEELEKQIEDVVELRKQNEKLQKKNEKLEKKFHELEAQVKASVDVPAGKKEKKDFNKQTEEMSVQERFLKGWE